MQETPAPSNYPEGHASVSAGPVTFADVKKTVDKLRAAGAKVSTLTVLAELGRGSKGTICTHYATLMREEASRPDITAPLSPVLQAQIEKELNGLTRDRTAQLAEKLEDAQNSLVAVASESESYVAAAAAAESRIAALQLSIAEQAGVVGELRERCEALSVQVVELGSEAERSRQALAICQERLRLSEERVSLVEIEKERRGAELSNARVECAKVREQLDAKERACHAFQLEAEIGRQAVANLEKARRESVALQSELAGERSRLASSEAQREGLAERLKDGQAALARSEVTCEQLLQKVLRGTPDGAENSGERLYAPTTRTVDAGVGKATGK
jgi:uncharacterized coiled-coil protein SlyX